MDVSFFSQRPSFAGSLPGQVGVGFPMPKKRPVGCSLLVSWKLKYMNLGVGDNTNLESSWFWWKLNDILGLGVYLKKHLQHFFSQTQNKKAQKDSKKTPKITDFGVWSPGVVEGFLDLCIYWNWWTIFCCQDYLLVFQTFGITKKSWDPYRIHGMYLHLPHTSPNIPSCSQTKV